MCQKPVNKASDLLRKFGIESSQSALRTEERMKRGLMPDTEAVKYTTVSLRFNLSFAR